jgi:hypothetical protein
VTCGVIRAALRCRWRLTCRYEQRAQALSAPWTRTRGSAAVVEGRLIAVGVGEPEGAAERPVGGR